VTTALYRVENFEAWRKAARNELLKNTPPERLVWQPANDHQELLFAPETTTMAPAGGTLRLPREFLDLARSVSRHRDPTRWTLLYRVAWRILNENRNLLLIEVDDDVRSLALMCKAVQTDVYKMRAFVRFRRVLHEVKERYIAWYRPDHHTLEANEKFFVERFGGMRWAILTPDSSMIWDLERITYGPGVPRSAAPAEDEFEELWRSYYTSIYNPARLNLDAMRAQLPVRRWEDLPESRSIPELVRVSRGRVEAMAGMQPPAPAVPQGATLDVLRTAVRSCSACELCARATQPVFGEGPENAPILFVGEQPGDEEDRAGRPFVGPAGQVFNAALRAAGVDRNQVYLANAVKAFRFEERGKRRIHQTPRPAHVAACRPWIEAEVAAVRPSVIVCLGATAAHSVLGRTARIAAERGRIITRRWDANVLITYHPSAILRAPDEGAQAAMRSALIADLAAALSLAVARAE
jgi:uracil-DNA glycosylase